MIREKLSKILTEYRGEGAYDESKSFDEMGFDSLDKVELLMKIEEEFDITFDDDLKVTTVKELVNKIESMIK